VDRRKVDPGESLDDLVKQVFLRHAGDLLVEREPFHDVADVLGKAVDVSIQIGRKLIGIVEQLGEVHLREVVERTLSDLLKKAADDALGLRLDRGVFLQHLRLRRREEAVKAPQHCEGKDNFAVLVTFRHTYRSWLDAVGTALTVQQKLMRHSDIQTTMNIYGDVVTTEMQEASSKVAGLAIED
jgi:hypothetical protein